MSSAAVFLMGNTLTTVKRLLGIYLVYKTILEASKMQFLYRWSYKQVKKHGKYNPGALPNGDLFIKQDVYPYIPCIHVHV